MGTEEEEEEEEEEDEEDEEDEEQSPKSVEDWIIDFNNKKDSYASSQEWQKAHYELNELYRHLEKDYNKKNKKIERDTALAPYNNAAKKRLFENKKIVIYYGEAMEILADTEDKLLEDWRAWEREEQCRNSVPPLEQEATIPSSLLRKLLLAIGNLLLLISLFSGVLGLVWLLIKYT